MKLPLPVGQLPFPCSPSMPLKMAVIQDGIALCQELHDTLKPVGLFPALTGGLLYKAGERKDIDIVIYRHRQHYDIMPEMTHQIFVDALKKAGVETLTCYGFVTKAKWNGFDVDIFNPESITGDDYV